MRWLPIAALLLCATMSEAGAAVSTRTPGTPSPPAHRPQQTSSSSAAPGSSSSATKKTISSKKHRRSRRPPTQKAPTADRISEIQTALAQHGYYQGDPNGKWDSNTVSAMQKFQSASGLDPTGKLDALSLQKLGLGSDIAGVSAPKPVPLPGSTPPSGMGPKPSTGSPSSAVSSSNTSSPVPNPKPPQY